MTSRPDIAALWRDYARTRPDGDALPVPDAWQFGDSPELADELARLVLDGVKTATCSALWEHEAEGEPVPTPGQLDIILDGAGQPCCIIETIEVTVRSFREVDARFAHDEGEGDRSLDAWRQGHRAFFTRSLAAIGRSFEPDMPLVCQRFRVVHRRDAAPSPR